MVKLRVKDVKAYFGFRQIAGDDYSLEKIVSDPNINRPGLELAGYFDNSVPQRPVILGDKELSYIEHVMNDTQQQVAFDFLTKEETPFILISRDHVCPEKLMQIAVEKNFPIFTSFAPTSTLIMELMAYLEEQLSIVQVVHGVLLNIHGKGVLLVGESGMGKSEIALELIQRGHILVADDRVDVVRVHNRIKGRVPILLKDLLEIRGIGIINVVQMFGAGTTIPSSNIDLVIQLEDWQSDHDYIRIGNDEIEFQDFFGMKIPKTIIPVRKGRNMSIIIESAVTNHILKERGYDSSKEFEDKVYQFILERREE